MKESTPKFYLPILIIAVVGLLDAAYLWIIKITNNQALCPQGLGDCWSVNNSSYSEIYGVPVSVFGILTYITIIVLLQLERKNKFWKQNSVLVQFGISLIGVIFSLYLTYIQFFVLQKICPFCIVSAFTITTLFILTIIRMNKMQANAR